MSSPPEAFTQFVERCHEDVTAQGAFSTLKLYVRSDTAAAELLETVEGVTSISVDVLVEHFWTAAEAHAATRVGVVRFSVAAYRAQAAEHECQHAFLIRGRTTEPASFTSDFHDSPNGSGLVSASLRAMNEATRQMTSMCDETSTRLARMLDAETKRRERAEETALDARITFEALLSERSKRELEAARELATMRRNDAAARLLFSMVPAFISDWASANGKPNLALHATKLTLTAFLGSLSEAQMVAIHTSLDDNQRLIFEQVVATARADAARAAREAELAAAQSPGSIGTGTQ